VWGFSRPSTKLQLDAPTRDSLGFANCTTHRTMRVLRQHNRSLFELQLSLHVMNHSSTPESCIKLPNRNGRTCFRTGFNALTRERSELKLRCDLYLLTGRSRAFAEKSSLCCVLNTKASVRLQLCFNNSAVAGDFALYQPKPRSSLS
jgi:hypothetical protein